MSFGKLPMYPFISLALARSVFISADWWQWFKEMGRNVAPCYNSMVLISVIAPSVNVLRRTRRKPTTIRGAAPDVVIGQSTAARAGAHPYLSLLGQFWSWQSPVRRRTARDNRLDCF